MSRSNFDFERMLNPIEPTTLLEKYWEKSPLLVARNHPDYYSELISLKNIDSILRLYGPKSSDVDLIKENSFFSAGGEVDFNQIYQAYSLGYSLVMRKIHERWQPLSVLHKNLEAFLNHPVGINLYMTSKNSQGFKAHFDTHDVFILQVEGSKQWKIYDSPITLPVISDLKYTDKFINQLKSPTAEYCLNKGDLLYIPRGYIHEVYTDNSFSVHLTVGIHSLKWFDLINSAVTKLAQKEVRFRESLPVGFLRQEEAEESLKNQFQELLKLLAEQSEVEEAVEDIAQGFLGKMSPLVDEQFYQLENLEYLNLDTIVKKREGLYRIIEKIGKIGIQFGSKTVMESLRSERAIRFILEAEEFPIKALPGLADNGKLTLVRRLIQEGILKTVEEG
ncbi:cupin domain-containing protein [Gloeothece verrucosa]|uniref:Cupin 4 family protein n=1 Tax=Gloeothece verrucosa (strain PCC 7822) TaxID=497965 RepID=E0UGC1_GLOV7|nr:cupin domain-containing protein [Gloeothece verrucosa]ADN16740.1 Cupin 4 family protein [Gloeothece verrucosa PCC 7822]